MKLEIMITEEDYIKFNIDHLKTSQVGKRINRITWFIFIFAFVLCAITFFVNAKIDGTPLFIPIILTVFFGIVMLVYMLLFNKKAIKRSVIKTVKAQKKDGKLPFSEKSVIEFADEEVIEETDIGVSRVKYDKLETLCLCDTAMYLYLNSQQAIILPYSQIGEQKEKIVSILKEKSNINIING